MLDDNTLIKIDELLNNDIKVEVNEKLVYNSYYIETYADKLHNKLISLNIWYISLNLLIHHNILIKLFYF